MQNQINVAPSSSEGHFIEVREFPETKERVNVVEIDKAEELFLVEVPEGETSIMKTKNHTDLPITQSAVKFSQYVFSPNPLNDYDQYRRSID
jgi:hypothetical protein